MIMDYLTYISMYLYHNSCPHKTFSVLNIASPCSHSQLHLFISLPRQTCLFFGLILPPAHLNTLSPLHLNFNTQQNILLHMGAAQNFSLSKFVAFWRPVHVGLNLWTRACKWVEWVLWMKNPCRWIEWVWFYKKNVQVGWESLIKWKTRASGLSEYY